MSIPTPPPEKPLDIEVQAHEGVQVVRLRGLRILNDRAVSVLGARLIECLETAEPPPRLVVCFDGVGFLSSAALGKLILIQRKARERGGSLKLCNLSTSTYDVFRVSRLEDFFDIQPDLATALASNG